MNGKECDPKDFVTWPEHDRNCPAKQDGWIHLHLLDFMKDSKEDRKELYRKWDEHDKLIHQTILDTERIISLNIKKFQGWLIGLLIAIIGGFSGLVITRYYSDLNIVGEIHKMQQTQSQIGWQSGKPIGNGD